MESILNCFIDLTADFFHQVSHSLSYFLQMHGLSSQADLVADIALTLLFVAFVFSAVILLFRLLGALYRFIFAR